MINLMNCELCQIGFFTVDVLEWQVSLCTLLFWESGADHSHISSTAVASFKPTLCSLGLLSTLRCRRSFEWRGG